MEFVSNGVRLHCELVGRGPTSILLHGFPETHDSWRLQVPELVRAGHRVAALDLRGYGKSDRPRSGYDLDTLASDVTALIDELGCDRVSLIGHDWGGAVAWHFASYRPYRLERAIICNCPHPAIMARAMIANRAQQRRSWYFYFFQLPVLPELWLESSDGEHLARMFRDRSPGSAPPELVDAQRRALLEPGALRAALAYYRTSFRAGARALLSRAGPPRYPRIDVPVTLLWGAEDSALGVELIEGSERFAPDLSVHVIPNAGHFVHQERPEVVNALLLGVLGGTMPPGPGTGGARS